MARQLYQLANVQAAFAARIREKVQGRREEAQEQADDIPLLGWLIRPLTGLAFDMKEDRNTGRGERGESQALHTLLRWLPEDWYVFHNVVVEPQPDEFAQIDLLLVNTAGLFLVETKAWRGSYKGYRDSWQQREGRQWSKVASPTGQVQRQARMLASWLEQQRSFALPASFQGCLTPLVVFTQPHWLQVTQCSVEVFEGVRPLLQFLQGQRAVVFSASQVGTICDLIIRSPTPWRFHPLPRPNPAGRPTLRARRIGGREPSPRRAPPRETSAPPNHQQRAGRPRPPLRMPLRRHPAAPSAGRLWCCAPLSRAPTPAARSTAARTSRAVG